MKGQNRALKYAKNPFNIYNTKKDELEGDVDYQMDLPPGHAGMCSQ